MAENDVYFENLRTDFPMLAQKMEEHPLVYLDAAATTHKPQSVIDAVSAFYAQAYATVHRSVYGLAVSATERYHAVRRQVQAFVGAKYADEIVFTRGTTDAINLVASSFGKRFIGLGDEILLSELEHHANIVPWQLMCEERGAVIKVAPVDDRGDLMLDEYAKLLGPRTRLVSIFHISNAIGTVNPLARIIDMAHAAGAMVLVDGAQSAPHIPVDVQKLAADFFVFSGHKIYGPTGIGVLYGRRELLEDMPPYQGGGDMIDDVTFEKTTYNVPPVKFEAGTPMIAQAIGLGAALDYISRIGLEKIMAREQSLLAAAVGLLDSVPEVRLIGRPRSRAPIVSFVVDGLHALDIGTLLSLQGIAVRTGHHCAQPALRRFGCESTTRMSFSFYNTTQEIELAVAQLENIIRKLT